MQNSAGTLVSSPINLHLVWLHNLLYRCTDVTESNIDTRFLH